MERLTIAAMALRAACSGIINTRSHTHNGPYDGDEGQEGPGGTAFHAVDEHLVARAFRGTSKKKSPGPDGIGPLAIACVYE